MICYGFSSSSASSFAVSVASSFTSFESWVSNVKCRSPFVKAGKAFGCGQCLPCRINRQRVWAHRMMIEACCHSSSAFVTLTYRDDSLPKDGSVCPRDMQLFLKRLRKKREPFRFRFFGVGEYGGMRERPHYHLMLFGQAKCMRGRTFRSINSSEPQWERCCPVCKEIGETWEKGLIEVGTVTVQSCMYCARYTVKKMTGKDDLRLKGRHPEFTRMSLRPGIGSVGMHDVASSLMEYQQDKKVDVPGALRVGSGIYPIGRYLKRELRSFIGREKDTPEEVLKNYEEELRFVREAAFHNSVSFAQVLSGLDDGWYQAMVAKREIYKKRESLS